MTSFTVADVVAKVQGEGNGARERVAVRFGNRELTYAQLEDRAERIAAGLARRGVKHGTRVCVLMHNRVEWLEVFFALARLGAVLVPVNHMLSAHEVSFIVEDSGSTWFIGQEELWENVPNQLSGERVTLVCVGGSRAAAVDYEDLTADGRLAKRPDVAIGDTLLLQYTSGTTGFPKGATHTHSTVLWNAVSQRPHFGLGSDTVYLCMPALSWVAGLHSLHLETLWSSGTVVLHPSDSSFDPRRFCDLVQEHGVTTVALVPSVLRRLLELPSFSDWDLSSLRLAIVGGESVPVHLLEDMADRVPHVSLVQVYGMSEFPSLVTLLEPEQAPRKLGSAGRANCVSQVRVVDEEDEDLPPGTVGEILTRSPATMVGYWGRPDATAEVLRGGWLHTGDLGFLDEEGYLYITGRAKDLIISGGMNIYPAEIEQVLARHEAVVESAVIAVPDDRWGEIAKAVVVLEGQMVTVKEDELRDFASQYLARYKIPKAWELRVGPPLPRTASGKLQKFRLREGEPGRGESCDDTMLGPV